MSTVPYANPADASVPWEELGEIGLFTRGQVAAASLLGGPLAGFVLLGVNFRRLAHARAAAGSAVAGVVLAALLWATGYCYLLHPLSAFGAVAAAIAAAFMWQAADVLQGPELRAHALAGGLPASTWSAAEVAFAAVGAHLALIAGAAVMFR